MIKPDIVIPHRPEQWMWLLDRVTHNETARADEYRVTFLREFQGDEQDLYDTTYALMPKSWGELDEDDKRARFYGDY